MKKIHIGKNFLETTPHGDYTFPVSTVRECISEYEEGLLDYHWHPSIEFIHVVKGEIIYQVNDTVYSLQDGEGIFVNSNSVHGAYSVQDKDCVYDIIDFDTYFVYGNENSIIKEKYVDSITRSMDFPSLLLQPQVQWQGHILELLYEANRYLREKPACYELLVKSRLSDLWAMLYQNTFSLLQNHRPGASKDIQRLKSMLDFVHNHYDEKITLSDIAESANVCVEICCRFFKRMLKKSPMLYLAEYRIQQSIPPLLEDNMSIAEIAYRVGFSSSSYYAETFKKHMACSPTEYKNRKKPSSAVENL